MDWEFCIRDFFGILIIYFFKKNILDGSEKPFAIADSFTETVRKLKYRPIIVDGFKPSRKNCLDLFPDIFFF
jgi:hypothetical protein